MASTPSSASGGRSPGGSGSTVLPYRMHVSQRYLDLTRQKLDIARLPREPQNRQQRVDVGVAKAQIEPLVDHWTDEYNWRVQEALYNETLPQYRLAIHGTRIHFVHQRSTSLNAIPLLIAQGWPESFIAVSHIIDALSNPVSTPPRGDENVPTFHVVVPSIPGCGFSDQVSEEGNNIATTAEAFDALMKSLGYPRYIAHGSGWGFRICRMIALTHPESCIAVHTANPEVPPPRQPNYAYNQHDMSMPGTPTSVQMQMPMPMQMPMQAPTQVPLGTPGLSPPLSPGSLQQQQRERPQTVSYALCDSPVGLLAYVVDAIRPPQHKSPPVSRAASHSPTPPSLPDPWSPTALISWAMLYWLPGPEVALRWLANSAPMVQNLWTTHSPVPLAISQFGDQHSPHSGPIWAEAYHRIAMVRRRGGTVRFAAWERPGEVVMDLRELAILVGSSFFGGGYLGPGAMMEH